MNVFETEERNLQALVLAIVENPDAAEVVDWVRENLPYDEIAMGVYVADDFSRIDFRSRVQIDPSHASRITAPYRNVAAGATCSTRRWKACTMR